MASLARRPAHGLIMAEIPRPRIRTQMAWRALPQVVLYGRRIGLRLVLSVLLTHIVVRHRSGTRLVVCGSVRRVAMRTLMFMANRLAAVSVETGRR